MEDSKKLTRRRFIEDAASAGLVLTATGCASTPRAESTQQSATNTSVGREPAATEPDMYQYIVVGAGAGGGPLAVRLAKRGYDVLLLDAGGDTLPQSAVVPAFHAQSTEEPMIGWSYNVKHRDEVPPLNIPGVPTMKDQTNIWYPRASGIGGCTIINAMVAMYPHPQDWQRIHDDAADAGDSYSASWHPTRMRELFEDRVERKGYGWRDNKGWHSLELNPRWSGITDPNMRATLIQAARSADNGDILDILRNVNKRKNLDKEGFFLIPKSTRYGARYGVYNYVMENKGRTEQGGKLTVLPNALVQKVNFTTTDDDSLRANSVTVAIGRNLYRAHKEGGHENYETKVFKANNEIILSAGAFNTPQLLLLSGIGPSEHFDSAAWRRIESARKWKVLEGVGRNLQDRYEVTVVSRYKDDFNFIADCEFKLNARLDPCYESWVNSSSRNKSIYSSNGIAGGLKLRSREHKASARPQDLSLFGAPGDFRGYYPGYSKNVFGPEGRSRNLFSWAILKGYSNNRSGQVKLRSSDFRDTPDIHFNYFGQGKEQDLDAIYEAIQKIRSINSRLGDRIEEEIFPGNQVSSEMDLKTWIEREAWGHHASCTARMGHESEVDAVVDYNFKVHGTQNLRIVDASVFPEIPGLFLVVPIYIIAERAADVIDMEHERTTARS